MHTGWIKLYRKIQDNPFCINSAEKRGFWIYLLLQANHKDNFAYINNQKIEVKIGQFITGRKKISKENHVSETKAERMLSCLESEHQIEQQKTNKYRIISIVNWKDYQQDGQQNGQQMDNRWTTDGQQMDTNKNIKNVKNVKNNTFSSTSNEVRLSELLLSLILKRNANHKIPNLQTWAKEIDKMIRIDKRTVEDIEKIIRWCQADNFWQNNILSTKKLREKFDQLKLKSQTQTQGGNEDDDEEDTERINFLKGSEET